MKTHLNAVFTVRDGYALLEQGAYLQGAYLHLWQNMYDSVHQSGTDAMPNASNSIANVGSSRRVVSEREHEQGSHAVESGTASATRSTATSTATGRSPSVVVLAAAAVPRRPSGSGKVNEGK